MDWELHQDLHSSEITLEIRITWYLLGSLVDVCPLTCDFACVVEGDVILSTAVLQLLLLFQKSQAHQMQYLYTQIQCIRVLWAQAIALFTQFTKRTWLYFLRLTLCNMESVQLPPLGSPAHCSTAPSTASNTSHCSRFTRLPKRGQRGGGVGGGRAVHTNKDIIIKKKQTNKQ